MTTLPDDFNPFEHLQSTYRLEFNKRIDRYFKDVEGTGDLSSPRASLKLACRIIDNDNDAMMAMRRSLFFDVLGASRKGLAIVHGDRWDVAPPVAGHPLLFVIFSQDESAVAAGDAPLVKEKSVRLMKYSCEAGHSKPPITTEIMHEIAVEIKSLFLSNGKGITYTCGNKSASYIDPDNGFPVGNYMLVNSKPDAHEVYERLCNAIDVPYLGENHIILNDPDKPSTTTATAGKKTILGKQRQNKRYRPVALLRFRYAYISLGTIIPPIFLLDTTFGNQALVKYL
jgi:hypothetical protein